LFGVKRGNPPPSNKSEKNPKRGRNKVFFSKKLELDGVDFPANTGPSTNFFPATKGCERLSKGQQNVRQGGPQKTTHFQNQNSAMVVCSWGVVLRAKPGVGLRSPTFSHKAGPHTFPRPPGNRPPLVQRSQTCVDPHVSPASSTPPTRGVSTLHVLGGD